MVSHPQALGGPLCRRDRPHDSSPAASSPRHRRRRQPRVRPPPPPTHTSSSCAASAASPRTGATPTAAAPSPSRSSPSASTWPRSVVAAPEALATLRDLSLAFKDRVVLLGVDSVDLFKGIGLKFLAMERLLEKCPELRGRAVLVQIVNPARSHGRDVEEVADEAVPSPAASTPASAATATTPSSSSTTPSATHGSAVVLAGRGRVCCSGVDLTAAENVFKGDVKDPNADPVAAMAACRKPIAGAVAGFAVTAGFKIAFACDLLGRLRRQVRQHRRRAPPSSAERRRVSTELR
uniref:Uncharacterized protein n=1 Tax=Ananas comosus var. bracteatus TaxID=296719 RepID=A0A6V7PP39_ANACO|nr:unnamed protein product [Ananas comosus var. bracteatus]